MPTIQAFVPLLAGTGSHIIHLLGRWLTTSPANKDAIHSIPSTTHSYGPTPRQSLDIYPSATNPSTSPILIFLYGGGITRGDKIVQAIPGELLYYNLGTFFATQGYTTIIPDYRRANDAQEKTGEDAVFPNGGDDLSLVFNFLESQEKDKSTKRDVYVMGNSAGGVHTMTFMLYSKFLAQRKRLLSGSGPLKLKGAIMLSVPCDFDSAGANRQDMLTTYWPASLSKASGSSQTHSASEFDPRGLLRALGKGHTREELGIPPVLMLEGELDPDDEILDTMSRFRQAWTEVLGDEGLETKVMAGHNHISPPMGLMSLEAKGEQWGHDVVAWLKKVA